jgi:hypothetical protein
MTPKEYLLMMDGHLMTLGKKPSTLTWNEILDAMDKAGIK